MSEPKIAGTQPVVLDLEPGTYYWCTCGHSEKQPFCDGKHKGTGFTPQKVELTEATKVPFCACKHSGKGHQCDGSHRNL